MTCSEIQNHLKSFFDDLLPEDQRIEIREHLDGCSSCRSFSAQFGSFGEDLRKTYALPSGVRRRTLQILLEPKIDREDEVSRSLFSLTVIAGFLLTLLIGVGLFYVYHQNQIEKESLEAQLRAVPSTLPHEPIEEIKPKIRRHSIYIKPLHWDLEFEDSNSLDSFHSFVSSFRESLVFESEAITVFSVNREQMQKLVSAVKAYHGGLKGGGDIQTTQMPTEEDTVGLSVSMEAPQSRARRSLSQHWHIQFQLPNRFALKDSIKDAGARMLYENPVLWVFKVPGSDVEKIRQLVRDTHGVTFNFGREIPSTETYRNIPVVLSIYIEDGL